MNSQSGSTNEQTNRSLVEQEDPVVQSGTSGVGPSTGQEDGRIGAAGPGTNESSATELRRKMKKVKLPGNEHFSLVDEEDERKVNCDLFPFPEEEYAQILGQEDVAEADMLHSGWSALPAREIWGAS